jgi:putative transposase
MPRKGHSPDRIVQALSRVRHGESVAEVCRKMGISEATFYNWKKQYAGMGIAELAELRQLREENSKLKRLVADLSLDKHVLQEIVTKKL